MDPAMPVKRLWTATEDRQIANARAARHSWDIISAALGFSRSSVIERARALGIPRLTPVPADPESEADREPLAAGDPLAWAVLTEGTLLEGTDYPARYATGGPLAGNA